MTAGMLRPWAPAARRLAAAGAVLLALGAAPLQAADGASTPDAAAEFVQSVFDRAQRLSSRPGPDPERQRQLLAFVRTGVDLVAIARFSTGPFWKQASEDERGRFLNVLETFVAQTFGRRLGELTGQTLKIVKAVAVAPGTEESRDMLVTSHFIGADSRTLGVDWRVRMSETGPRIVDLVVGGISMAVAQRDEFITIIRNGGGNFAALIAKLEEWTAEPEGDVAQKTDTTKPKIAGANTTKR